ncbi:hypothetical protein ACSNOH_34795, partial [Streptomyces sp. URMC 127]
MTRSVRAGGLLTAAILAVTATACTGADSGGGTGTGHSARTPHPSEKATRSQDAATARQTLSWKPCPPPTPAEGGSS